MRNQQQSLDFERNQIEEMKRQGQIPQPPQAPRGTNVQRTPTGVRQSTRAGIRRRQQQQPTRTGRRPTGVGIRAATHTTTTAPAAGTNVTQAAGAAGVTGVTGTTGATGARGAARTTGVTGTADATRTAAPPDQPPDGGDDGDDQGEPSDDQDIGDGNRRRSQRGRCKGKRKTKVHDQSIPNSIIY